MTHTLSLFKELSFIEIAFKLLLLKKGFKVILQCVVSLRRIFTKQANINNGHY